MTGAKHLLLTPHGYTLRVKVPRDLRERIGKREIKKSLSTFNMSHAIKVAGYLMLEIKHVFSVMRGVGVGKRQKFNLPICTIIYMQRHYGCRSSNRTFPPKRSTIGERW